VSPDSNTQCTEASKALSGLADSKETASPLLPTFLYNDSLHHAGICDFCEHFKALDEMETSTAGAH
jgi:hypothetical protein